MVLSKLIQIRMTKSSLSFVTVRLNVIKSDKSQRMRNKRIAASLTSSLLAFWKAKSRVFPAKRGFVLCKLSLQPSNPKQQEKLSPCNLGHTRKEKLIHSWIELFFFSIEKRPLILKLEKRGLGVQLSLTPANFDRQGI